MDFSLQLEAVVTHAVSQLTYKWLPVPLPLPMFAARPSEHRRYDLFQLSLRDWFDYIEAQRLDGSPSAWMRLLKHKNLSEIGLATLIFDNLQQMNDAGAVLIDFFHPAYPYLLKHIPDPPACLACMGDLSLLGQPKLCLVGSRKASDFAFQESRALGLALAQKGAVVVSGGAVGCDAAAHLGALESELTPAPTIVVFAGGLRKFYPQCLSSLFERLQNRNALFISERLWEYPARPIDFPVRNRIIAGLSSYLAVMQAGSKSGALKTASYALEQGREVYALVHEEDDIRAEGSRQILEDGALPFLSAKDFLSLVLVY